MFAKSDYDGAARAYMSVALLIDDPSITPRALQKAADAYRKVNNTFEADRALSELRERFPNFQKSAKTTKDKS
jgi:TolA-binding protein